MADVYEKISPSQINKFYTCPYQYYCKYIARRPVIKTPDTMTFGLTVHNCIDHYYDTITNKTKKDEVHDLLEKAFTTGGNYSTTSRKKSTRKAMLRVEKFEINSRIRNGMGLPSVREKMLYAKINNELPIIQGKPDLYFESTGDIVDWKTGGHAVLDDSLKIQGKMYELLLKAHGYKPKRSIFDFVVVGKRIIIPSVSTGWFIKKIEDMLEKVRNDKFKIIKSPLCTKWCEYRLSCDLRSNCVWAIP